jgi:hypothetical protein
MAKKSKWFRVAVEGATTDGRELTAQDLKDMAETYNRDTYGARVNLEHYRGLIAGTPFDMLGDVLALKTQDDDIQIGGKSQKRTALYAEIQPLDNLITMNKAGQKIFTSIEMQPDFAKTGKAGLVGLAVTDTPASLGTEILQFSSKNPAFFASRKQAQGNVFTEALETSIEFVDDQPSETGSALEAVTTFFRKLSGAFPEKSQTSERPTLDDPKPEGVDAPSGGGAGEAVKGEEFSMKDVAKNIADFTTNVSKTLETLTGQIKKTNEDFAALKQQVEDQPDPSHRRRPPVSGDTGQSGNIIY